MVSPEAGNEGNSSRARRGPRSPRPLTPILEPETTPCSSVAGRHRDAFLCMDHVNGDDFLSERDRFNRDSELLDEIEVDREDEVSDEKSGKRGRKDLSSTAPVVRIKLEHRMQDSVGPVGICQVKTRLLARRCRTASRLSALPNRSQTPSLPVVASRCRQFPRPRYPLP